MVLSESVPVWIMAGSVAVGGWFYEQVSSQTIATDIRLSSHEQDLAVLEVQAERTITDLRDIRGSLIRIEDFLRERNDDG